MAVGQGRLSVSQIADLLEARDTQAYPHNIFAPACGLFLTRVDYKESGKRVATSSVRLLDLIYPGLLKTNS